MAKLSRVTRVLVCLVLASCSQDDAETGRAAPDAIVDTDAIAAADPANWLSHGRTYDEQRYSPLDVINTGNVAELGLAWFADLDTARGQEATPLVIDGRIFISTAWSKVKAYDGASGQLLWEFDPQVPGETAVKACCDVVNRGLATWGKRLYLGTLDGRLIALDRESGEPVWSEVTVDQTKAYTITGAPRVIDGRVIIGNGGAEFGVRGYVSAYDADDGQLLWRFYTVPDQPGRNEDAHLLAAESTWTGEWWRLGGGGTVWDAMAFDPEQIAAMPSDFLLGIELNDGWNETPQGMTLAEETVLERQFPGEGEWDMPAFMAACSATGYEGPFGVEVINAENRTRSLDELVRKAYATTAAMFA